MDASVFRFFFFDCLIFIELNYRLTFRKDVL